MKISGFTIIRNAVIYDYPIVEAITSILPLCDEVVVALGNSDDDTQEMILGIGSPKIKIIHTTWDESLREGGRVLADETDKALAAISPDADWAFYIQGDEVIHEKYLPAIRNAMEYHKNDARVEGLLFNYLHFYGSYDFVGDSRRWYRREVRVIRNIQGMHSFRDAQGFRLNGKLLRVKHVNATMYHYGWVKPPEKQSAKQATFNRYWHTDQWIDHHVSKADEFDYSGIDALATFRGSHPQVMQNRIAACNWEFSFDPTKKKFSFLARLLHFIEKKTGYRVGEYKNFRLLALLLLLAVPALSFAQYSPQQQAKALRIHSKVFTVDSHADTPMNLFDKKFDISKDNSQSMHRSKVDFARMKKGGLDGIFFAVFEGQGARTPAGNAAVKKSALTTFDSIHSVLKRYPQLAELALTPADGYRLEKSGKRAIFIGVENGYAIGRDLSNVKLFYDLGGRYITLCHTKNNDICSSSTDTNNTKGLSLFGKQVVTEMNRLGMMVDVSHISDASFYDVLKMTKAPVIASHSCARALCGNPRNLSDDMLSALSKNGGVAQMCILSAYVKTPVPNPVRDSAVAAVRVKWHNFQGLSDPDRDIARREYWGVEENYPQALANVSDVCDHIDHMVKIAGINHVGIGTDFDGGGGVSGCNDVSQMGNITLELVRRGYTERQIRKIWGGNLMRVMRQVEKQAGL